MKFDEICTSLLVKPVIPPGATGIVNVSGTGAIRLSTNQTMRLRANAGADDGTVNQSGGTVTFYRDAGLTTGGNGILYLGFSATAAGITVTNPGVNYTTASFTLVGGGIARPAVSMAVHHATRNRARRKLRGESPCGPARRGPSVPHPV